MKFAEAFTRSNDPGIRKLRREVKEQRRMRELESLEKRMVASPDLAYLMMNDPRIRELELLRARLPKNS